MEVWLVVSLVCMDLGKACKAAGGGGVDLVSGILGLYNSTRGFIWLYVVLFLSDCIRVYGFYLVFVEFVLLLCSRTNQPLFILG